MSRFVVFFLLMLASLCAADTSLRASWVSKSYKASTIPQDWLPSVIPPFQQSVGAFEKLGARDVGTIDKIIGAFGLPTRYLISDDKALQDFLIYDLSDGHCVGFYVPKPPGKHIMAGVILDPKGNLLKLIK